MIRVVLTWQPDGWGSRARIGVLTRHNDIVPEGEFQAMAPEGVSIHAARVPLGWRSGPEAPPIGLHAARVFVEPPHVDEAAELCDRLCLHQIGCCTLVGGCC